MRKSEGGGDIKFAPVIDSAEAPYLGSPSAPHFGSRDSLFKVAQRALGPGTKWKLWKSLEEVQLPEELKSIKKEDGTPEEWLMYDSGVFYISKLSIVHIQNESRFKIP